MTRRLRHHVRGLKATLPWAGLIVLLLARNSPANDVMWGAHIEPILAKNCFKCHGETKQKGHLDLRSLEAAMKGGDNGSAVLAGQPDQSPLLQRVHPMAEGHMPPGQGQQLSVDEIELLRLWVERLPRPAGPVSGSSKLAAADKPQATLLQIATAVKWEPPAGMSRDQAVDFLIQRGWQDRKVIPTGRCDDATFVRRVYLDLFGRIPTVDEAAGFVADKNSAKRGALVDRLLASEEYAQHMADVMDVVLMGRQANEPPKRRRGKRDDGDGAQVKKKWEGYLESAFAENRPWNKVVYDLIDARPQKADDAGAVWFLYQRQENYQAMAEAVGPLAFGVQIGCAQCHSHPLAREIGQQHYWGLVAAFNRSKNAGAPGGAGLAESAVGGFVNFTNLKKESQPALLALLTDQTIAEDRPADGAKEDDSADKYAIAPGDKHETPGTLATPKFSRRQKLAEAVTQDNPLLARAMVNRVWAMLMGRGLVHPVDEMDSRHPPSHPELLAWLARDFEAQGYDIRKLVRLIVLSDAYQLAGGVADPIASPPEAFARALERPLSAEAIHRSLLVATGRFTDEGEAKSAPLAQTLAKTFPDLFASEYNASLQQAMFLSNNPLLDELLRPEADDTTAALLKLSSPIERVNRAFAICYGRLPNAEEQQQAIAYLDAHSTNPEAGVRQLLWAMLCSAEFLMNH